MRFELFRNHFEMRSSGKSDAYIAVKHLFAHEFGELLDLEWLYDDFVRLAT
ncbi:MAG: hypothetical protein WB523_00210 [Candidatus Sulfotelmatobacter sp.]